MAVGKCHTNKLFMGTLRYQNKKRNSNEKVYISKLFREQIEVYGQEVNYYHNLAELKNMSPLYGENQSEGYAKPRTLLILCNLNNDAYLLSKFGIISDADLSGVIHPDHFNQIYGFAEKEPKAGDLIEMAEFGEDRLGYPKRGATVYQLTEVRDEFEYNPLGWHIVWSWKAKRYDYSGEPGSPGGGLGNNPMDDNDILEEIAKDNFNYDKDNPCSKDSVYGDY